MRNRQRSAGWAQLDLLGLMRQLEGERAGYSTPGSMRVRVLLPPLATQTLLGPAAMPSGLSPTVSLADVAGGRVDADHPVRDVAGRGS